MPTMKIFFLRPCPLWNHTIRAEEEHEFDEPLAKILIGRGVAETSEARKKRMTERAEKKKAEAKAKEEAAKKLMEESVAKSSEDLPVVQAPVGPETAEPLKPEKTKKGK